MRNTLLVTAFLLSTVYCFGQAKDAREVSIDALLTETQYSSDSADYIEMVWWLPEIFWEVSFSQDPSTSKEDVDAIKDLLKDIELFAIVKGKIGMFGGITYTPLEEIKDSFTVSYNDKNLQLIAEEDLSPDVTSFLSIMSPMMANMLGPMGENVHFLVMENPDGSKLLPIDPTSTKEMKVSLANFKRNANLPLASLLLEKQCPVDNKMHSGKWTFCPFHGEELTHQ